MKLNVFFKIFICIFAIACTLYLRLAQSNEVTKLKVLIPRIEQQLFALEEENYRLSYEIETFESPAHLIELSKKPEFSHLRHPYDEEILVIALDNEETKLCKDNPVFEKFSFEPYPIIVGAKGK